MNDRTVEMYYAAAIAYADGAVILLAHPETAKRDYLILPSHTCIGLALELGYKAVFIHLGGDPKILKKIDVRHNLLALRDLCLELGFKSSSLSTDVVVRTIGGDYAENAYRYLKSGTTINFVSSEEVAHSVVRFVDEVAVAVGYPPRPNPA